MAPFLSRSQIFFFMFFTLKPTRGFELVRRTAYHCDRAPLYCCVLPCAPVYYYYRFSTLSFRDHKQVGVRRTMPRNNGRD